MCVSTQQQQKCAGAIVTTDELFSENHLGQRLSVVGTVCILNLVLEMSYSCLSIVMAKTASFTSKAGFIQRGRGKGRLICYVRII